MMRILLAVAAACALAACAPKPTVQQPSPSASVAQATPTASPTPEATPSARPADEASCKASGGTWRPICRMQTVVCVANFADAGKACRDGDDCLGDCRATNPTAQSGVEATGQCTANDDPCGCNQRVEDGKTTPMLCAD